MKTFIHTPFIPSNKVKTVIADMRIPLSIQNKIRAGGINIIKTPYCKDLYKAISSHPDILLHHLGGNEIVVAPNVYNRLKMPLERLNFKVILGNTFLKSTYPDNVAYNVGRVKDYAIHNFKYTDKKILEKFEEKNVKKINVKQGYSKCSICVVSENAIITSDKGIAREVDKYGIDVLLIRSGYIDLWGMNYGFIGGATGLIGKNKLLFCGNIKEHPDYKIVEKFLEKHCVIPEYIEDQKIIDLGSIIPILELCKE